MFEKQAEEYLQEKLEERKDKFVFELPKVYIEDVKQSFQKGAEFGYNKANEWHYPSKGELPKVNQECYFIHSNYYGAGNKPIFTKSSIQVHAGSYTYALDEEGNETTDFCFYDDFIQEEMDINEVYAWKEIVLLELPKESEKK